MTGLAVRDRRRRANLTFGRLTGALLTLLLALMLPGGIAVSPEIAYGPAVLLLAGLVAYRYPTTSLVALFLCSGAYASIEAFTGLPAFSFIDGVIGGLWVAVLGGLVFSRRRPRLQLTPAFLLVAGFMALTIAAALVTEPSGSGLRALRLAPLFLSVGILVGWGGFSDSTLRRLARGITLVCLILAAYATLRWQIGPAAKESALTDTAFDRQYNQAAGEEKVRGALFNGFGLGLWMACTIPFLVTMTLAWRGPWRLVAAAALPLSLIGLLGSGQRTGVVAVVAGSLTIVSLHTLARGHRGLRVGAAFATVIALIVAGGFVYPAVVDNPEQRERYENILTPEQDLPFQERLTKWRQVLAEVDGQPFGFGLGAGNMSIDKRFVDIASQNIDNSFLMIAFDQGLAVMALFILTLLVLLFELIRHSVWTRAPGEAAFAAAGAGTLVALMVEFVSANYYTAHPVIAGWMIVGLGVAQYALRRDGSLGGQEPDAGAPDPRPAAPPPQWAAPSASRSARASAESYE